MTITDLYPYLIIIGSSILAATGWLLHQYRMQLRRTRELIQLNEDLAYDLPDFLRECWPILKKAGFLGFSWELEWFGTRVTETHGLQIGQKLEKKFDVQEISLLVHMYRPRKDWEQRYFSNAQADSFFLLIRMNLWIKLGTVQRAFDQTAKMTVFLKHDVKNMVQLLSLSADQLHTTQAGQEQKLLTSLRTAIPAVRDRAEHMLRALNDKPAKANQPDLMMPGLALEKILQQTASLYDLPVKIVGEALVAMDKDQLLTIVDNLLGNYSTQARKKDKVQLELNISIEVQGSKVVTSIEDIHGGPFPWPERLFEPFWSEHGNGRGIGLYQARQQANAVGGDLSAIAASDRPLRFILTLPVNL
ncbi:MAG: ATP-binding protein [Pseudomonadota bacterium]